MVTFIIYYTYCNESKKKIYKHTSLMLCVCVCMQHYQTEKKERLGWLLGYIETRINDTETPLKLSDIMDVYIFRFGLSDVKAMADIELVNRLNSWAVKDGVLAKVDVIVHE